MKSSKYLGGLEKMITNLGSMLQSTRLKKMHKLIHVQSLFSMIKRMPTPVWDGIIVLVIILDLFAFDRQISLASSETSQASSSTTMNFAAATSDGNPASSHNGPSVASPAPVAAGLVRAQKKPEFTFDVVTVLSKDDRGNNLRMPSALFFDHKADELYLINGGDNRIVVYGPDYFPQESLGQGRGLEAPTSGYVDDKGNIYLPQSGTPTNPPRVMILNSAFLPVKELTLAGIPNLDTFTPEKIALGVDGIIYLTGRESTRVLVLKPGGDFLKWFVVAIEKNGEYRPGVGDKPDKAASIKNVAVDALGNLFLLSEETSKTYVFDAEGRYLFAFGTKGGAEGKLSRPRALAIDEQKKCIYVVDYMRQTVSIFDFTGAFRFEFGGRGWGEGWFNYPVDITLGRQGHVIVADFFNQRAQVFEVTLPIFPGRTPELWQVKAKDTK